MTYENALKIIHSLNKFGIKPGLDRIKKLLALMGNPQNRLKFVHVAGTNGKGSTCALISSVLVEAGYKTGLFISPYITDFRERIQINGKMISKQTLANAVEETYPLLLELEKEDCIITEFEYVMAIEFYIHCKENCDVVVLETGLGGLYDCTNVILPPLCSVITTIGLDHTAILGNTIEEIAQQKCGIIKENSPVITSSQDADAMEIIRNTAKKNNSKLTESNSIEFETISENLTGTTFTYKGINITLPLIGKHQIENAKTAMATIEVLKNYFDITDENIATGFAKAVNPARFEVLSQNPLIILDGAHNPNGIEALKNALETYLKGTKPICIMGMLADKDSKSSVKILKEMFSTVITVPVDNPRSLSAQELKAECSNYFENVISSESPFEAFDRAFALSKSQSLPIIICGSLYLAGEIRPYILENIK
ncbi:MAG: bifunctional folylpolyglutamate synthase/dihydrofolate synthase [Ruminococcus sp.]